MLKVISFSVSIFFITFMNSSNYAKIQVLNNNDFEDSTQLILNVNAYNEFYSMGWGYTFKCIIIEKFLGNYEGSDTISISIVVNDKELYKAFAPEQKKTIREIEIGFQPKKNDKPYNNGFSGFVDKTTLQSWEITYSKPSPKITFID